MQDRDHSVKMEATLNPKTNNPFYTLGYIQSEPTNSADSKAVAIYDNTRNKVGYLYKSEQTEYYSICNSTDAYPCVILAFKPKNTGRVWVFPRLQRSIIGIDSLLTWCRGIGDEDLSEPKSTNHGEIEIKVDGSFIDDLIASKVAALNTKGGISSAPKANANQPNTKTEDGCLGYVIIGAIIVFLWYIFFK